MPEREARYRPHLRGGAVAAFVEHPSPWGVAGILHNPKTLTALPSREDEDLDHVPYGHPGLRWIIAARDVISLHGCTPVFLDELMTLAT
ncbi:hypothetical protein ACIPSA_42535 [Streptomyces sp. NPDC086549]|uniref:hypothetical protein n=1 Tax=Streptomyces sp. NPDC086549 TaxID=3365752 RepID=UPI003810FECA